MAGVILLLCVVHYTFLVVTVKKWLKSVYIYGSYRKLKQWHHSLDHPVHSIIQLYTSNEYKTYNNKLLKSFSQ